MNQIDTKFALVDQSTDFEVLFSNMSALGYRFATTCPSPFGVKMVFQRESDTPVTAEALEQERMEALTAKFGGGR